MRAGTKKPQDARRMCPPVIRDANPVPLLFAATREG